MTSANLQFMSLYGYFTNEPRLFDAVDYLVNEAVETGAAIAPLALITLSLAGFAWVYYEKHSTDFYKEFPKRIDTKDSYLFINDKSGCRKEKLLGVIGKGGSKKAVLLEQGRVLMVPNCDVASLQPILKRWNRMVIEEVTTSNILNENGLLSPLSERVTVSLTSNAKEASISAYVCESFENIEKTQNLLIYDVKNKEAPPWKTSLFFNSEDRFQEEKWDDAVDALLDDISKIFIFNLPRGGDSLNIAFQKNPHFISGKSVAYKARFFGFDFSSKCSVLEIGKNVKVPEQSACKHVVQVFVDNLVNLEFNNQSSENDKFITGETFHEFFDRLIDKYCLRVLKICEESLANAEAVNQVPNLERGPH